MKIEKGILPIYKPKGPTSFDMIKKIRKITDVKKVGHAGTLDPLASGVLIVGIGRENTKQLSKFEGKEKEYEITVKLGEKTETLDDDAKRIPQEVDSPPEFKKVKEIVESFKGEIEQVPPKYSAVKVKGTPAYKLARQGKEFELSPRKVNLKKSEILNYNYPLLKLRLVTGKGFYVRSLARDIGEKLRTGAFVLELTRTRIGDFKLEDCKKI